METRKGRGVDGKLGREGVGLEWVWERGRGGGVCCTKYASGLPGGLVLQRKSTALPRGCKECNRVISPTRLKNMSQNKPLKLVLQVDSCAGSRETHGSHFRLTLSKLCRLQQTKTPGPADSLMDPEEKVYT